MACRRDDIERIGCIRAARGESQLRRADLSGRTVCASHLVIVRPREVSRIGSKTSTPRRIVVVGPFTDGALMADVFIPDVGERNRLPPGCQVKIENGASAGTAAVVAMKIDVRGQVDNESQAARRALQLLLLSRKRSRRRCPRMLPRSFRRGLGYRRGPLNSREARTGLGIDIVPRIAAPAVRIPFMPFNNIFASPILQSS